LYLEKRVEVDSKRERERGCLERERERGAGGIRRDPRACGIKHS
jgi:hypothetical protein